jgi:hypothetical protein
MEGMTPCEVSTCRVHFQEKAKVLRQRWLSSCPKRKDLELSERRQQPQAMNPHVYDAAKPRFLNDSRPHVEIPCGHNVFVSHESCHYPSYVRKKRERVSMYTKVKPNELAKAHEDCTLFVCMNTLISLPNPFHPTEFFPFGQHVLPSRDGSMVRCLELRCARERYSIVTRPPRRFKTAPSPRNVCFNVPRPPFHHPGPRKRPALHPREPAPSSPTKISVSGLGMTICGGEED